MRIVKKGVGILISVLMILSIFIYPMNVAAATDDISNYKFSYLTEAEAKAFIGFLINDNNVDKYTKTDIYKYLIGNLKSNKEYEDQVKFAFAYIAESLLNKRLNETSAEMNNVTNDLIEYMENKYGTSPESAVVNGAINKELSAIKKSILGFIAIATDTDLYEIEAVDTGLGIVKTITNPKKKMEEYMANINAAMNVVKFADSVQRHEMYEQFVLYIQNAKMYINFGNTEISNSIIYLTQSSHDLYNEKNIWAGYIEKVIKAADIFGLLDNYWLDWSTDNRIALMKKWAALIVYSSKSAAENVTNGMTEYTLSDISFSTDSGQTVSYKARLYKEKYELTKLIDTEDLNYSISDSSVAITGYKGYGGKYTNVALPDTIKGYPVTKIGNRAFDDVNWHLVIIPETVTSIEDYAFYNNPSLENIVILGNTKIANTAFDWRIDGTNGLYSDQSVGNVPIWCNNGSKAKSFAESKEGFYYKSLAWDGKTVWGVYPNGNKINIYTGNELNYVAYLANAGVDLSDCEINLKADIDLGNNEFTSIGATKATAFNGSFNGNSHSIKNFYPNKKGRYSGVFGYVSAVDSTFKNVKIYETSEINVESSRGSLIGEVELSQSSTLHITNITAYYDDTKATGGWEDYSLGGIVGKITAVGNSNITFNNCNQIGDLIGKGGFSYPIIGGILGRSVLTDTDTISFIKCSANGTFSYTRNFQSANGRVAGIIGKAENGNYLFNQCCVKGKIQGDGHTTAVGGYVSDFSPKTFAVENCELFANVIAKGSMVTVVGGFFGHVSTTNLDDSSSYINNSFVSAVLNSTFGATGAFISSHDDSLSKKAITLDNCFYDNGKKGLNKNHLIISNSTMMLGGTNAGNNEKWNNSSVYSSEELKTEHSLYNEWDFDTVWEYADSGYPKLKTFSYEACASHDYKKEVTQPTCNDQGYTTYTCTDCGYEYKGDYIAKLGHSYTETIISPTCTAQGYTLHKCIRCDNSYKDNYTDKAEHIYKPTKVVPPTCQDFGYTIYTCENCDATVHKDFVSKLTHQDSATVSPVIVHPTCQDLGYTLHTCGLCGETYKTDFVSKLEHQESIKIKTSGSDSVLLKYCVVGDETISEKEVQIETYTDEDSNIWKYVIADNEAYICEYNGDEAEVEVPSVIDNTNVVGITESVFNGKKLVSVILPNSIKIIGANAFENCTALKSIILPSNLTSIAQNMFYNCGSLAEISIDKKVSIICNDAFFGCHSLEKINYNSTESKWKDIVICEGNSSLDNIDFNFVKETTKTYYFINNKNWYEVYAYTWYYKDNGSAVNSKDWPGEAMSYVGVNDEGYKVYSIDASSNMDYIIFDMGSSQNQTVDILLSDYEGCNAFSLSDNKENNNYRVEGLTYDPIQERVDRKITPDAEDDNVTKFGLATDITYSSLDLLGVQKKGDGTNSIRFVTTISSELLNNEDVIDYGYVLTTTSRETAIAKQDSGKITIENGHVYSCKNTTNNMTGGYGDLDFSSTKYKYVTMAVNNIGSDKAVVSRFYMKTKDKTYYAKYTDRNGDTFDGCVVRWNEISNG